MADQVTKIIIRNGTNLQRRTTNNTGVVFNIGEPAYCTDTQRLYVGNGGVGGIAVGMRNLGKVSTFYGTYLNSGFSQETYNVLANRGADVGDIIFDQSTRTIYSLSARSNLTTSFVPVTSDFVKFDASTLVNSTQFYYDSNLELNLQQQGVDVTMINSNLVDGVTIIKPSAVSPISVAPGSISNGVANTNLRFINANSLFLNNTNAAASPNIVTVYPGQVVGRTSTSQLTAVGINQILFSAAFVAGNGLIITPTTTNTTFDLDPLYWAVGTRIYLNKNTNVQGTLSASGAITTAGALSVNSTAASSSTSTGALVVGGGVGIGGTVHIGGAANVIGDITAFYSSDRRLKDNIKNIDSALSKVNAINGVSFDWNSKSDKTGKDYGVIADEIEKILPELVTTRDTGYKAVRYEKIIPLLIEAIKELNKKIK